MAEAGGTNFDFQAGSSTALPMMFGGAYGF